MFLAIFKKIIMAFRIWRLYFRCIALWTQDTTQFESFLLATDGFLLWGVNNMNVLKPIFVELAMTDLESMKAVICLRFFQVQKWKSHPSASEPIFLPTDRVCCCLSCLLWQRFILLALQPGNAVLGSPMECWSSGGAKGSSPACQERACPSLPHAKWIKAAGNADSPVFPSEVWCRCWSILQYNQHQ